MAQVVGFNQDPQLPPGGGEFTFDDGRKIHAFDPATANQFLAQNDAGAPNASTPDQIASYGPPPTASDAGPPPMSSPPRGPTPPTLAAASPGNPPAAVGGGPSSSPEISAATPGMSPEQAGAAGYVFGLTAPRGPAAPAHFQPGTRTIKAEQEGAPRSEEEQQQLDYARQDYLVARQKEAQAQAAYHTTLANQATTAAVESAKQRAAAQADFQRKTSEYEGAKAEIQRLSDENDARIKNFDPNKFWHDRSTFEGIGLVLAQAMGAYAATLSHGQNWAKSIIDDAINRDITRQKEQIEQGGAKTKNALQMLTVKLGDKDKAETALRQIQTNQVLQAAQAQAEYSQSEQATNAFNTLASQFRMDNLKADEELRNKYIGKREVSTNEKYVPASTGGPDLSPKGIKARAEALKAAQEVGAAPNIGLEGQKLDIQRLKAEKAGKAQEDKTAEAINATDRNLQRAQRIKELYSIGRPLSPKERGELEGLQSQLQLELPSVFSHSKRVNETEIHMMGKLVGDPESYYKGDYTGKTRAGIDTVIGQMMEEKKFLRKHGASADDEERDPNAPAGFSHPVEEVNAE